MKPIPLAICLALLGCGPLTAQVQPPLSSLRVPSPKLVAEIEAAEAKGLVALDLPKSLPENPDVSNLEDTFTHYAVFVGAVREMRSELTAGGEDIHTWVKFSIEEDLSRQKISPDVTPLAQWEAAQVDDMVTYSSKRQATLASSLPPDLRAQLMQNFHDPGRSALLPIKANEFLVEIAGGTVLINGIRLKAEGVGPLLTPNGRYLLFVESYATIEFGDPHIGFLRLGAPAIFRLDSNKHSLRPLVAMANSNLQKAVHGEAGDDLADIRSRAVKR